MLFESQLCCCGWQSLFSQAFYYMLLLLPMIVYSIRECPRYRCLPMLLGELATCAEYGDVADLVLQLFCELCYIYMFK